MALKRKKTKYSIILVEDDFKQVEEVEAYAKKYDNLQLLAVTDRATEGYHLVKSHKPDILVVDIHLKEGDGLELIRKIREDKELAQNNPYIVVITANKSPIIKDVIMNLADFIYSKNEDYKTSVLFQHLLFICENVDKKSAWTSSLDSDDFLAAKDDHIKKNVEKELANYKFDLTKKRDIFLMHEVVFKAIKVEKIEKFAMTTLYDLIKKEYFTTSANINIETVLQRLISDIFHKTDSQILSEVYPSYNRVPPTTKEFVAFVADKIKKENGYDW